MPRGLGGKWAPEGHNDALVLRRASCEACREITHGIEEDCLTSMWPQIRHRLGLREKNRNPGVILTTAILPDGKKEDRLLNADDIHAPIAIPVFGEPGVLTNRPIQQMAPYDIEILLKVPANPSAMEGLHKLGIRFMVTAPRFAQMLAKIGLGLAVAKYGIGGFQPLVQDFIRSRSEEYGHWVGGYKEIGAASSSLHKITLSERKAPAGLFIIAFIRLFAEFGAPTNYVVVGRPISP
jgi:hypothetical protein